MEEYYNFDNNKKYPNNYYNTNYYIVRDEGEDSVMLGPKPQFPKTWMIIEDEGSRGPFTDMEIYKLLSGYNKRGYKPLFTISDVKSDIHLTFDACLDYLQDKLTDSNMNIFIHNEIYPGKSTNYLEDSIVNYSYYNYNCDNPEYNYAYKQDYGQKQNYEEPVYNYNNYNYYEGEQHYEYEERYNNNQINNQFPDEYDKGYVNYDNYYNNQYINEENYPSYDILNLPTNRPPRVFCPDAIPKNRKKFMIRGKWRGRGRGRGREKGRGRKWDMNNNNRNNNKEQNEKEREDKKKNDNNFLEDQDEYDDNNVNNYRGRNNYRNNSRWRNNNRRRRNNNNGNKEKADLIEVEYPQNIKGKKKENVQKEEKKEK